MSCTCIDEMNANLAPLNTELCLTFSFGRSGGEPLTMPMVGTKKIETKKRAGPALAIPTFCPFCGARYRADDTKASAS